jgi:hypothetical protein
MVGAMADEAALRQALDTEAKRVIVDCTYSGRGHLEASHRWASLNTWLGLPVVILSAVLASGAGLNALIGQNNYVTATLALLSAVLTSTRAFFNPGELAEAHGLMGNRYLSVRNAARLFREIDLRSRLTPEELTLRLRDLRERCDALNETPPQRIPRWAYERAKRRIAAGEAGYEDDPLWKELSG